ncbi:MAG: TonB-dependent receptor [Bacteroidetes bacterium]|nr:TonB-dependent receptor [Bacteroidota bacterium]
MALTRNLVCILIIGLLFSAVTIKAQSSKGKSGNGPGKPAEGFGVITGTLHDATTAEPIAYGNIFLLRIPDSSMVTGAISDTRGRFTLDKLPAGNYILKLRFIGYKTTFIPSINISASNADIQLGEIKLQAKVASLSEVEITSQRSMITNNLDKKVITVDKNMAVGGGTATDIMENIPSVSVDADGNVSLRGNTNITLLIDGKPSSQAGIATSDVLNQIPANAIESIEVITNPSVRYDPDGTSGIINIVMKKKALQGFNGMISGNAGTGDKYNGSLNLNFRQEKFNIFLGADGRMNHMKTSLDNKRTSDYNEIKSVLLQSQSGNMRRDMYNLNGGFDYFVNTRNTLTISIQHRNMSFGSQGNMHNSDYDGNEILQRYFERYTDNTRSVKSNDYTLSYKHLFPQKGREFTNDIIFNTNQMDNGSDIRQQDYSSDGGTSIGIPLLQNNTALNDNNLLTLQGNYVYPKEEAGRIEAGYKAAIRDMKMRYDYSNFNDSTGSFVTREDLKNHYDYKDQIYAIYGLYGNSIGEFEYQAGLRFEQVWTRSKVALDNKEYNSSYSSFYPSLHTQYKLGNEWELQFSYSRRVERPSPRELNPYIDYSDSLNIETGNPALKPEYSNSIELGVEKYWDKSSLSSSLFYDNTHNSVEDISRIGSNNITITMPMNIGKNQSYGVELVGSSNPAKWIRINANLSVFREITGAIPDQNIPGSDRISWSSKLNTTFNPWKDGTLQLIANYSSPTRSSQEFHKEQYYADASFRQDFLKNKLSLTLRLTDIFNTRKFSETTYGNGFTTESRRYRESRVLYIGFQLKINNYNKKIPKDQGSNENGEGDGF